MPDFLKSRIGAAIAGIYFILILFSLIEDATKPPEPMQAFGFLILTAPWSFLLALAFEGLGILTEENGDRLLYLFVAFGAVINLAILYLIGLLLTKVIGYFSSPKKVS